jgi:hypothetical protein
MENGFTRSGRASSTARTTQRLWDASTDSRTYKKVNDHTLLLTNKKDGKVTASGRIVVSADGKSRTVTVNATNSEGVKVSSTAVYDKQ